MNSRKILMLFSAFLFTGLIIFISCSEEEKLVDENLTFYTENSLNKSEVLNDLIYSGNDQMKNAGSIDPCGPVDVYPLIASQNYFVGTLIVYNDEDNLYVIFKANDGLQFTDFHLYIGTQEGLPVNNGGNIQIGHFPFKDEISVTGLKQFVIPLSEITDTECFIIAAHAVMGKHTIWAFSDESHAFSVIFGSSRWGWILEDCIDICDEKVLAIKTWMSDSSTGKTFYAFPVDGDPAFASEDWCKTMSIIIPENGGDYNLNKWGGSTIVANLHSEFVGDKLVLTLSSGMPELLFDRTYVFYGNSEELDYTQCPAYTTWPKYTTDQSVQIIEIPLN